MHFPIISIIFELTTPARALLYTRPAKKTMQSYMLLEVNKICILCIVFLPGGRRKLRVNFQDHEDVISFWHSSVPHAVEQRISDRDAYRVHI